MLHAELHNKLSSLALEYERNEDVLTSTVFGTLLAAEGGPSVLREWLQQAEFEDGPQALRLPDGEIDYRFWPSLGGCTPDLALRFDDLLYVLEMKYRSGASDIQREGADESELQLAKQWEACRNGSRLMHAFGRTTRFRHAAVLYVVDGARGVRGSRNDVEKARQRAGCHGGRIGILFWQQLFVFLRERMEGQRQCARWINDLALLLERRQLGTFTGFPKRFDPAAARHAPAILGWRRPSREFRTALQLLQPPRVAEFKKQLKGWRRAI